MKKTIFFTLTLVLVAFLSCNSDKDNDESNDLNPSNLAITAVVFGADGNNPNGNGSGIVDFTITATNATYYKVTINNEDLELTKKTFRYTFTRNGTKGYPVVIWAYNSTGSKLITSIVEVYVNRKTGLVWQDEFDIDGAPNPSNWGYDLGDNGWGNNELQNYTNSTENAIVENGMLKIIARANGSGYTSARLKSQGLQAFNYGKIEVRAKLPASAGTWPAIWMLGSNFTSVGWPHCGEMDIMEQKGWDKSNVLGTFHWQDNVSDSYAGYGLETEASTSTSAFHLYSLEWTPDLINVLYDNESFVAFANNSTFPFNADFFLILNIAMGGNLGGNVDPDFTQDTMEIDYIRVYQ